MRPGLCSPGSRRCCDAVYPRKSGGVAARPAASHSRLDQNTPARRKKVRAGLIHYGSRCTRLYDSSGGGTLRDPPPSSTVIGSKLKRDQLISARTPRVRTIVLALLVRRILNPGSKYASALRAEAQTRSLGGELALEHVHENAIYQAMDWLYKRKDAIEQELAARHLKGGIGRAL